MTLDWQTCERARLARDPRFDGRFFTAVLTTGIFCRPICPAPTPKPNNVRYYASAAAAGEAGFRPCLRCRPEAAPGSPLWQGSEAVVARAHALIQEGYLNHHPLADLADLMGLGERQLRRLFHSAVGASPKAVADMQRLLFAKKLLHETRMSLTEVALAAGFNSIRRFNDAFRQAYGKTPSELRRAQSEASSDQLSLLLPYRPPLNWPAMLGFYRMRAIPGVERVDDQSYSRTIALGEHSGWLRVEAVANQDALKLTVAFPDPGQLMPIVERIRRMFDLNANLDAIYQDLARDPLLKQRLDTYSGLRLPGAWDPFEYMVRAILGQQISVKAATTFAGRIASTLGTPVQGPEGLQWLFPRPEILAEADFSRIGLTGKRIDTIKNLSRAVAAGEVSLRVGRDLDTFIAELCALPGIGDWTAHYIALRALSEPDAFPSADLGLLKALGTDKPKEAKARAEAWRPWRAYAAIYLWQGLSASSKDST